MGNSVIIYDTDDKRIDFLRQFNADFEPRVSQVNRAITADGTQYSLYFFTKHELNLEKILVEPELRRDLDAFQEFAESGASFEFVYDDDIGLYVDFRGERMETNDGTAITTSRAGNGTYLNPHSGLIETTNGDNTPRLEDGRFPGGLSLLSEGQAQNECTRSEAFDHADWVKFGSPTITANVSFIKDPAGGNTADFIEGSGSGTNTLIYTSSQATSGKGNCSVWLRSWNEDITVNIIMGGSGGGVSSVTNAAVTTEWKRFNVVNKNSPLGNWLFEIQLFTNTDKFFAWGAQIEDGVDYPSSYIATNGSIVTRSNESHLFGIQSDEIRNTKGSINFWVYPLFTSTTGTQQRFINIYGVLSTGTDYVFLNVEQSSGNLLIARIGLADNSGYGALAGAGVLSQNTWAMVTVTWDTTISDSVNIYHNGSQVAQSTNDPFVPVLSPDLLEIGLTGSNARFDDIALFTKVLSASEINSIYNLNHAIGVHRNRWDDVTLQSLEFDPQPGSRKYNMSMVLREK